MAGGTTQNVLVVLGTRPEAIKLAPVIDALQARSISTRICATAQHRELLDRALGQQGFEPDIDLDLMRPGQSLGELTGRMINALDAIMTGERPTCVVVQGDTASALGGAQAAYLRGIQIAHVEAGLRTGDLTSPHPEEGIRRMIAAIADVHFAPTERAAFALMKEGIAASSIHVTGNTIVDALYAVRKRIAAEPNLTAAARPIAEAAGDRRLVLVTCHRRENHASAADIARALRLLALRPDVMIALPLHPNPALSSPLRQALAGISNIKMLDPLDFATFIALLSAAHLVITDSGGVQEEALALGIPALIMRDCTERPESVIAGAAQLVGTSPDRILPFANAILDNPEIHARMTHAHNPYGDGRAAALIADIIAERLSYEQRGLLAK